MENNEGVNVFLKPEMAKDSMFKNDFPAEKNFTVNESIPVTRKRLPTGSDQIFMDPAFHFNFSSME